MSALTQGHVASVANRFALQVAELLTLIREELQRIRELHEGADRWNFIGAGTVQGGTTTPDTLPHTILEANPKRTGLTIVNLSTTAGQVISIGIGNRAPQINTGVTLLANGGAWDGRLSGKVCQQSISIVGSAAGIAYSWVESM